MASTFECLGFALDGPDDLPALLDRLRPAARFEGRFGGVDIRRWEDPSSGARVVFGERDGTLEFLLPSFAATVGVRLARWSARSPEVFAASVAGGSTITFELEERHFFRDGLPEVVDAAVIGFGNSVAVVADAVPGCSPVGDDVAAAMIGGAVIASETRVNSMTGTEFHVVQLRVGAFDMTLCLSAGEFASLPAAGEVIAGTAFVVVSIPSAGDAPRRAAATKPAGKRWWKR